MMTEKLQKEMNGQITAELWSANLYLSMAFYMQREGLDGCAHWLKKQSEEETSHACQIAEYMVKRDATPLVDKVDVVPQTWGNALEVFEAVYRERQGYAGFPLGLCPRTSGRRGHCRFNSRQT